MSTSIRYLRLLMHTPAGSRRQIGYLSQYGDVLRASFDEEYINDEQRPLLSLSYKGANELDTKAILSSSRDARLARSDGRWPTYFQNLLPEGHNRDRLARQRGCGPDDEFELLAAAGHDLMGAVEVEPVPVSEGIPESVRNWHVALGLDVIESELVEPPVEDAASLPGVISKFSAVQDGRRFHVKRDGAAGSFILKLPTARHEDLVQNEFTAYRLAGVLGLNCAEAHVISREDADIPEAIQSKYILAVKRFDRGQHGLRIHMEEFTQVLGYEPKQKYGKGLELDYSNMLRIIDQLSDQPAKDAEEFVKRFVAFVLMGNADAHLKNWALIYPDGRNPRLAPLYDPVCISALFQDAPASDYGVNRAIDAKVSAFSWSDLESLLRRAGIARRSRLLQVAKQTVKHAQSEWPAILTDAPDNVRIEILGRLRSGVEIAT